MTDLLWLDIAADVATILAALAVIATTFAVWRQMRLQAAGQNKDERRFLRESIFVVHDTLQGEQFRNARQNFFGSGQYKQDFNAYGDDDKGRARYILSVYGLLARMIDHDAIDEAVASGYWKTAMFRDWDRLENFVSGERLRSSNGTLFSATEQMVARWKKGDQA
ncbi:DUF4760 domain-containing protein [Octadecabacter sp. CECT 8868]|uniref:DUF4760 domain-containing protein n=1 Tax=Octadecabacter algicola TaxID=2909342 RepID=UPI001F3C2334|nr:DUF4760 domain-containing protein [Octadecabacter algicola]MCF2905545.1 DUF4760 domain-containing protein [Octadecabacter algicola]